MNSAIADMFFQSAAGASSENDMYFAVPHFMFLDNYVKPQSPAIRGAGCFSGDFEAYTAPTIYDLLMSCSVTWGIYAEGWVSRRQVHHVLDIETLLYLLYRMLLLVHPSVLLNI